MKAKFKFLDYVYSEKYGKGMVHCDFAEDWIGVIFNSHGDLLTYDENGVGLIDGDQLKKRKRDDGEQRYTKHGVRIIE